MRLLLACEHHPITPARYMADAFEAMPDVDLRHIGTARNGNTGFSDTDRPDIVWQPDGGYQCHWSDWTPDLILFLDTISDIYHHRHYADVPHIWYHIEGLMDNVMKGMQYYFHATSYGANWELIPDQMTWLPPAYAPAIHTPSSIPWEEREYDVCLVGRLDTRRDYYLQSFREAGLSVFWDVGLVNEDYAAAYHNSRLSLVEHFASIVPMRTFETAAMGNLLFSQWFDDYDKLTIEGVAVLPKDFTEAATYAQRLLAQPEECQRMIDQSLEWVQPHTYTARAQVMVDWFEGQAE